jgi:CubicO group peptidase (beta-lactamase class C family)
MEGLYGETPDWMTPDEFKGNGCAIVSVFCEDKIVWSKAYGWFDLEKRKKATTDAIVCVGSISNCFAAVALLQLAEKGLLGLDEPIETYVPEIRQLIAKEGVAELITLRMLASHTSGLSAATKWDQAYTGGIDKWKERTLQSIPYLSFRYAPGDKFYYSPAGYALLCLAISRASGQSYFDYVEQHIFKLLALDNTFFAGEVLKLQDSLAIGLHKTEDGLSDEVALSALKGNGLNIPGEGIYSTVGDLSKFAAALMGVSPKGLVTSKSLDQLFSIHPPAREYGLGFMIENREHYNSEKIYQLIGHSSRITGYRAALFFNPESRMGVAMLRNVSCWRDSEYCPDIESLLYQLVVGMDAG